MAFGHSHPGHDTLDLLPPSSHTGRTGQQQRGAATAGTQRPEHHDIHLAL